MGQAPSLIIGTEEYEGKAFMHQGGEDVLDDCEFFNQNDITHVVGVCHRSVGKHVFEDTRLTRDSVIHLDLMDSTHTNLYPHFEKITKFIHSARMNGGNVYVHCSAGVSRSSTVTLCYMMTVYDLPFSELLGHLRRMRTCVNPNYGFQQQLMEWENDPRRLALRKELLGENEAEWNRIFTLDKTTFLSGKTKPRESFTLEENKE